MEPVVYEVRVDFSPLEDIRMRHYPGWYVHALFLNLVGEERLIEILHGRRDYRPYSVTPPFREDSGRRYIFQRKPGDEVLLRKGERYSISFRILSQPILHRFINSIVERGEIRLCEASCTLEHIQVGERNLLKDLEPRRFSIRFLTPTALSSRELRGLEKPIHRLFPTPVSLFGNMARRWNRFLSSRSIDLDWFYESVERGIYESAVRIRSYMLPFKQEVFFKGIVGSCEYTVEDRELSRTLSYLLEFSRWMNVGKSPANGFGVIEYSVLEDWRGDLEKVEES